MHFVNRPAAAVWSIAPKLGIDFTRAIQSDAMSPQDLSEMLSNCASCWHSRKCARWARDVATDAPAAEAPEFCASRDNLNALAAGKPAARSVS